MGASALSDRRTAACCSRRRGRAQRSHRGACRARVAPSDQRRVHPLLVQDHRAMVVHRPRRERPLRRARAQGPRARRHLPERERRARRRHRRPAPGPSALELSAPSRQPPRARARGPPTRRHSELSDGRSIHERAGSAARPQTSSSRDRRRRVVHSARDAFVRGRPRARPLAPGLSSGVATRIDVRWAMAIAAAARHSR